MFREPADAYSMLNLISFVELREIKIKYKKFSFIAKLAFKYYQYPFIRVPTLILFHHVHHQIEHRSRLTLSQCQWGQVHGRPRSTFKIQLDSNGRGKVPITWLSSVSIVTWATRLRGRKHLTKPRFSRHETRRELNKKIIPNPWSPKWFGFRNVNVHIGSRIVTNSDHMH